MSISSTSEESSNSFTLSLSSTSSDDLSRPSVYRKSNFRKALKERAFFASCAENSIKKIKRNKVIKQVQEPTQVPDFPSEQKELYRHRLHHQMDKNIRNQLNNTKEELKKISRQTKININQI